MLRRLLVTAGALFALGIGMVYADGPSGPPDLAQILAILGGNLSGPVTLSTAGVTSIGNNAVTNAMAAQGGANTLKGNPTSSTANEQDISVPSCSGATQALNWTAGTGPGCVTPVLNAYLDGFTLSNDTTTPNSVLDIASGGLAADSTNAVMMTLGSTIFGSTAGAWVSGAGSSGSPVHKMGNGLTIAANTWYDVCLGNNGGSPDVWFDTSNRGSTYSQCANRPSGITDTKFRRIGSFLTDGSSHILAYFCNGDECLWKTPVSILSGVTTSATAALATMQVPTGIEVWAKFTANVSFNTGAAAELFYPPDMGTQAVNTPSGYYTIFEGGSGQQGAADLTMRTNTSGQIGYVSGTTGGALYLISYGYTDRRGRDN